MAHDFISPETFDAVYWAGTRQRVDALLRRLHNEIFCFRGKIDSLSREQALPARYREAYGRTSDALRRIDDLVQSVEQEALAAEWPPRFIRPKAPKHVELPTDQIAVIRRKIEEINQAELKLVDACESTKAALQANDPSGLIDWSMPFDYQFTVYLDPGPARAFYEACGEWGEPLGLPIGPYPPSALRQDGVLENWNIFQFQDGHPLQADHHGYLVHCILDHSVIPWYLMLHIKEIEVRLEFIDTEVVWAAAPRLRMGITPA